MPDLRTPLRLLAPVLGAVLTASACGGGGSSQTLPTIAPTTAAPAPTTAVAPTTTVVEVPTTEAVSADTVPATTVPATTTLGVATTTTISGWTGAVHPLTGLPATDGTSGRPALVVKVGNNDSRSLPHVGLEAADVVYEAHIENGVTRFLAVYHSEVPLRVGPVRSARSSDIDLIGNLDRPTFAYWGSNEGVGNEVETAVDQGTFLGMTTTGDGQHFFFRAEGRAEMPYDGMVDSAAMAVASTGLPPDPIFAFGPLPASAIPIRGLRWLAPRRTIDWVWSHGAARWARYHQGVPLLDDLGVQLAADNVLVLFVDYRRSAADFMSPQALSTGSGDGWLLRDGTATGVTWSRPFAADRWTLTDDDTDAEVFLRPGRTWVALARLGEAGILDPDQVVQLTG